MARRIRITWDKIKVHKSESYGLLGEAGDSAEWNLLMATGTFEDNLNVVWDRADVRDGLEDVADKDLDCEVDGPVNVRFFGIEKDDSSDPDEFPRINLNHAPEPGWDAGGVSYKRNASNDDFDYSVYYTIRYLDPPPPPVHSTPGSGVIADVRYSGIWDAGQDRTEWALLVSAEQLHAQTDKIWSQGGRIRQLQPHVIGSNVFYNVIWRFDGGNQVWNANCDEDHFRKSTDENWNWARPAGAIPFVVDGAVRYACWWDVGQYGQVWSPNTDEAGFRKTTDDNWTWARPHQAYAFVVDGAVRYSCLWNAGQHGQVWQPNCSQAEAQAIGDKNWGSGRAHQLQPFRHNDTIRYSVLWNAGQHGQAWNLACTDDVVTTNNNDTWSWARPTQLLAFNA